MKQSPNAPRFVERGKKQNSLNSPTIRSRAILLFPFTARDAFPSTRVSTRASLPILPTMQRIAQKGNITLSGATCPASLNEQIPTQSQFAPCVRIGRQWHGREMAVFGAGDWEQCGLLIQLVTIYLLLRCKNCPRSVVR
jgi:hypothetical protein